MIFSVQYGSEQVDLDLPIQVDIKGMWLAPDPVLLPDAIEQALQNPIGAKPLVEIAADKLAGNPSATVVIVVSDNTRPVPYSGQNGLICRLIGALKRAGFPETQITVLIGAGSHRNMTPDEAEEMLSLRKNGLESVRVINHEYDDEEQLVDLGQTSTGSIVKINKLYLQSDLKIVTGLVESHFMAGASGGRKGICPGIVGKETLTLFHGAKFLSSKLAADLVLKGNPLNDEALEVARMAGCDFLVNATLDDRMRITGIFAGDLIKAHLEAVKMIRRYVKIPLQKLYDIVIVPAGFVGINHYQAGKAAIEASKALKPGGQIIIVAKNTDADPIGGNGYKQCLELLNDNGKDRFAEMISEPGWNFIQEQWQVQMWCKVLDVMGSSDHLLYLGVEIPPEDFSKLPGLSGWQFVPGGKANGQAPGSLIKTMLKESLSFAMKRSKAQPPEILLLKDGPYGIPELVNDKGGA